MKYPQHNNKAYFLFFNVKNYKIQLWILVFSGLFSINAHGEAILIRPVFFKKPAQDGTVKKKNNSKQLERKQLKDIPEVHPVSLKKQPKNVSKKTLIADERLSRKKSFKCELPENVPLEKDTKNQGSFEQWLNSFTTDALANGISQKTTAAAFKKIHPIKKVIELDRRQKEYSVTFSDYLRNSISPGRIKRGKSMLKKHHTLLKKIEGKYGVQPQILVALWAMESDFGENTGNFSTIDTLATLAYEGRRHNFFRNELVCTLRILDDGHIHAGEMKSSWAGAMGQPQFMPSTLFYYGADGDGDGKKDIWSNKADVFASAANYLKTIGWKARKSWGSEVKLPKKFDPYQARFSEEKSLKEWRSLGVKKSNGQKLSNNETKGSILLPSGINGPAFLVLHNFRMIREWNKSMNYALTVGHLSDRLTGSGPLLGKAPKGEKNLTRNEAVSLQSNLKKLGFYTDKIDGMVGLKSGDAIREYQTFQGVPADAYPSSDLMARIQKDADAMSVSPTAKQ